MGYFRDLFRNDGIGIDYQELFRDAAIRDLKNYQGLILMGGPMNVDQVDEYPFLKIDDEYIAAGLELGLPMMGFCLGGQLLAKGLGAEVKRNPKPELGWYELELTTPHPSGIFKGFPARCHVFQWHRYTFGIPPGAIRLAGSGVCENQAFSWDERVFGFQFHLEMTAEMVAEWLQDQTEVRSWGFHPEEIRRDTMEYINPSKNLAAILYQNFRRIMLVRTNSKDERAEDRL